MGGNETVLYIDCGGSEMTILSKLTELHAKNDK